MAKINDRDRPQPMIGAHPEHTALDMILGALGTQTST